VRACGFGMCMCPRRAGCDESEWLNQLSIIAGSAQTQTQLDSTATGKEPFVSFQKIYYLYVCVRVCMLAPTSSSMHEFIFIVRSNDSIFKILPYIAMGDDALIGISTVQ
jgi:hypothetical protein